MHLADFVGHNEAKLALLLNAADPRCGGILIVGARGMGKSTLARSLKSLLMSDMPFIELPLNITEDALVGTIAMEETVRTGVRRFQPGLFSRADRGVMLIDDINLHSHEILSLILEVHGRGENIVEREGIQFRHPASFVLIGTMCPAEGNLSSHFLDRFGMCIPLENIALRSERKAIIKSVVMSSNIDNPQSLCRRLDHTRSLLDSVILPDNLYEEIADLCLKSHVAGHRADLFLSAGARTHAAWMGRQVVSREDIGAVAPLVLVHRSREPQPLEHNQEPEVNSSDNQHEQQQTPAENEKEPTQGQDSNQNSVGERADRQTGPSDKDQNFDIGETFSLRRIVLPKDRIVRSSVGRRTKTKVKNRGGSYIKSVLRKSDGLAIDATLRAAAPYQPTRGRKDLLIIEKEDFRYKRKERKMAHLVIFVVDGSGSMGAQKRMSAAKGAVQSILLDCYQKRDMVAMIVFRKDCAEVVLEPTSSALHAARQIREIPVGGKTPLSAGLFATYQLVNRFGRKHPHTRFLVVLITDGRANQAMGSGPIDAEIAEIAQSLRDKTDIDAMVIDTEKKGRFITTNRAVSLAAQMGADYYTIEDLKSEYLSDIVKRPS